MKTTNNKRSLALYSFAFLIYLASENPALANLDLAKGELPINNDLITDNTYHELHSNRNENGAYINIYGKSNYAFINQSSSLELGNTASINQNGNNNKSLITQGGEGNNANIDQYGNSNLAIIAQSGYGNDGSILQEGNENKAILSQSGDSLEGSISQTGNGNLAYIVDSGNVSMSGYDINQSGQSSLIIINGMNRNINMTLK